MGSAHSIAYCTHYTSVSVTNSRQRVQPLAKAPLLLEELTPRDPALLTARAMVC